MAAAPQQAPKAWELTLQLEELFAKLEAGEIDEQAFADTVEGCLADDLAEAADRIGWVIRNAKADQEKYDAVAKEFQGKAEREKKTQDRLKGILHNWLTKTQQTKMATMHWTFTVQANPPSLAKAEGATAPPEYTETKTVTTELTSKIKDDLKAGKTIPGYTLVQGTHLRMK